MRRFVSNKNFFIAVAREFLVSRQPMISAIQMQLLSYFTGVAKSYDVEAGASGQVGDDGVTSGKEF